MKYLILPGLDGSGAQHWQTQWEATNSDFIRVQQNHWDNPDLNDWIFNLEQAVTFYGPNTILVAHSLGCLLVASWAASTQCSVKAALLVAPPDPQAPAFPSEASSFADFPNNKLKFASTLVASTQDPYADLKFSENCATQWGSDFINIGDAGHINASSQLGVWDVGQSILKKLVERAGG